MGTVRIANLHSFYKNKRVFVTGSTGFVGAWLCAALAEYGAYITGFALPPPRESLYSICNLDAHINNNIMPYLHVLDTVDALLAIAEKQCEDRNSAGAYNICPSVRNLITVGEFADLFCDYWGCRSVCASKPPKHLLDQAPIAMMPEYSGLPHNLFWQPKWSIEEAVKRTTEWYKAYYCGGDPSRILKEQLDGYINYIDWLANKSQMAIST